MTLLDSLQPAVLLACAVIAGCGSAPPPDQAALEPTELAQARVLSELIENYGQLGGTIFVCVDQNDATSSLTSRVTKSTRAKLKPCHGWVPDNTRVGVPVDPETRTAGVIITISHLIQLSATDYQMEGAYHCGILCAASFLYHVRREGSGWVIVSESTQWIS